MKTSLISLDPHSVLVAFSVLIVLSYLFNLISGALKIPAVILLLATGIALNYIGKELGYYLPDTQFLLEILGITGLIFIVLEGSLDLKITRTKLPLIGKSFLAALVIAIVTAGITSFILVEFVEMKWENALLYSVPLCVISSAIAIPSVTKLSNTKKEFIVYESTFSDIIGIMMFYFIIDSLNLGGFDFSFLWQMAVMLVLSAVSTGVLLLLLNYSRSKVKFYLIFAVLILIYSLSKMMHLPSLLLILIFGLMLNNANLYLKGKIAGYLHLEKLESVTEELKLITSETAFIIRTFFFLLFGYSIDLMTLNDPKVIFVGSMIILAILLTRAVFLRFISKSNLFPEIFIAPRGLITIVLFYSIPSAFKSIHFNEGIMYFVVIVSTLMMMLGLMVTKQRYISEIDEF